MICSIHRALTLAVCAAGIIVTPAFATTTSLNSGSLGPAANGTNTDGVVLGQPSRLAAAGDLANGYSLGERTTIAYQAALNPVSTSPFTVEFWANPAASDNDDTPLSNRFATGNRSGWTFFQRAAGTGWNFRMYNGVGSEVGWDLTGGTANLNSWSHVVATWDGSAALLYVNGTLVDSINDATAATKTYNANLAANAPSLNVAANFDGGSASTALVDEVAFYGTALNSTQIGNHFALADSPTAGAYQNAVIADGALLYLQNIPEPTSVTLLGIIGLLGLNRRRR